MSYSAVFTGFFLAHKNSSETNSSGFYQPCCKLLGLKLSLKLNEF